MDKLGFKVERERDGAVGIKDQSGLTVFLQKTSGGLTGQKIMLTIQVGSVDRKYEELSAEGVRFVSPPKLQFWGYGAEVLDPHGYTSHLWDEVTMQKAMWKCGRNKSSHILAQAPQPLTPVLPSVSEVELSDQVPFPPRPLQGQINLFKPPPATQQTRRFLVPSECSL